MNGDHVLLSGVIAPEDAPPDKILRDVIPLYLPEDARGKTWKVYVGLWHVRRGGSRVARRRSGARRSPTATASSPVLVRARD